MLHPRHMTMLRLSLLSLAVIAFDAYAQNGNDAQHGFVPHEADQHALGPLGSSDIGPVPDFIPVPGEGFPEKPGPAVLAPTAFTPDGDGLNDKYFPHVIGMELGLSRFRVFDRWGRELLTIEPVGAWPVAVQCEVLPVHQLQVFFGYSKAYPAASALTPPERPRLNHSVNPNGLTGMRLDQLGPFYGPAEQA